MFEVTVESSFAAAHRLRDYEGACERLHGHNYRVAVTARARELAESGLLVDFKVLKGALGRALDRLDHRCLNDDVPEFGPGRWNTTAENIARWVFENVRAELGDFAPGVELARASVWESDRSFATYFPD